MDITTSQPSQEEATALVAEFVRVGHDEWPGEGGGYDFKFLVKQLEARMFAIYPIPEWAFEDAVENYGTLQDLKQLSDADIADFYEQKRYRDGMREKRIADTTSDYNKAINDILLSAGYKHTSIVAVAA